jgi:hypothetical protein
MTTSASLEGPIAWLQLREALAIRSVLRLQAKV